MEATPLVGFDNGSDGSFIYFKDHFDCCEAKRLEMKTRVRAERPVRRLLWSCTKETMAAWAREARVRHGWSEEGGRKAALSDRWLEEQRGTRIKDALEVLGLCHAVTGDHNWRSTW